MVTSTINHFMSEGQSPTRAPGDLLANIQLSRKGTDRSADTTSSSISPQPDPESSKPDAESSKPEGSVPLSQRLFNPFATQKLGRITLDKREALDEDNLFRESILECMFKAIGLTTSGTTSRDPESLDGSPRLVPYDGSHKRAISGSSVFGFMDPVSPSADGDAESTTSGGAPTNAPANMQVIAHDMKRRG